MRTRLVHWLDLKSASKKRTQRIELSILYGIDVFAEGQWQHAHRNGKPLIFKTEERAQAERAKLRKLAV